VVEAAPVSLEHITAHWDDVGLELKRMNRMPVSAFVISLAPCELDGDYLTVRCRARFHHDQVTGQYRQVIEEALQHVFGRRLVIRCELSEEDEGPVVAPPPSLLAEMVAPPPGSLGQPAVAEGGGTEASAAEGETQAPSEGSTVAAESPSTDEGGQAPTKASSPEVDRAVQQTLSLFEGSRLLGDDE
jgi:hypothetical protein